MPIPTIIVHGGAGAIQDYSWLDYQKGTHAAARAGQTVLDAGGSAIDAVCAAVIALENDQTFNAGTGSALTLDGNVECDAFVMRDDLMSGAVAGVNNVRNPVMLARAVMEQTPHHLLVGLGAMRFAERSGVELCRMEELIVPRRMERYEQLRSRGSTFEGALDLEASDDPIFAGIGEETSDTVGACAVDSEGHIAVASSTGGIMLKTPGRSGDVPVVGSGSYCGPFGAVTCTGHGEAAMRVCLAKHAYDLLEDGLSAKESAQRSIRHLVERVQGAMGLIIVDRSGARAWAASTPRIAVGIPEELVDARSDHR